MIRSSITAIALTVFLLSTAATSVAQTATYQQMSPPERAAFVSNRADMIALEISARKYSFTPEFISAIQQNIDNYLRRLQKSADGEGNLLVVLKRGQVYAPTLGTVFQSRNLSPLLGIYLPMIESAFHISASSPTGAKGMFQFLPSTGQLYGLSPEELLAVEKSADAAARYLIDNIERFRGDSMREALALLAYNRGARKVAEEVKLVITLGDRTCSICALTAASAQLDESFRRESVHYVPQFFAAAIIGENPRAFGLEIEPLSSYVKQ